MMLLRASNMGAMRLQLAVQREDRRLAMAAMDDLVALDRELSDLVAAIPAASPHGMRRLGDALDLRRGEVMQDRLVLARGKAGPALVPADGVAAPEPPPEQADPLAEHDYAGTAAWWPPLLVALLVTILLAGGIAFASGLLDPYLALLGGGGDGRS
jgi:hypothetical protein